MERKDDAHANSEQIRPEFDQYAPSYPELLDDR